MCLATGEGARAVAAGGPIYLAWHGVAVAWPDPKPKGQGIAPENSRYWEGLTNRWFDFGWVPGTAVRNNI